MNAGRPSLQRGTNAVGARRIFSQAIARCNARRVEGVEDGHFWGGPFNHYAIGRWGENADSVGSQVIGDPLQDWRGPTRTNRESLSGSRT